jgi:hypothetical protein
MNSMILHELYFAGLGSSDMPKTVRDGLARDFGSVERWQGLENRLIRERPVAPANDARIHRRTRLGGMLIYYQRVAA